MALASHIAELEKRHELLEKAIDDELHSPGSDDLQISELKRQKLKIKEEITRLSAEAKAA
ncbi:MAG: DUF465 domain-containing protein [Alphaproteobacteria bacterium]|nr:DUF465 domain-containing protein [Rhodobiaceae bacterium]MBO6543850.1 DUF465 domain-containing protein [Alphaproteobacteria bacterium]MBO6628525.1 DUF465 domain-containing protein [Alphaproteobacteria bacterium]MDF1626745.1 DUF465 domain-containing protein [Parvibaculaceae bacterium]|tara:strand:+ start:505 stop:684 length:180 start_codon:yes stop_codon:yes gene_type:complete